MKITIIGGGNMGGAIARGLIKGTLVKPEEITISDLNEEILSQLKAVDARLTVTTNNVDGGKCARAGEVFGRL
jgi:pyrroline-5-carboxylate reductase